MSPLPSIQQSSWLLAFILAIVWALLLFGGFLFGKPTAKNLRRMPRWTRMASSATLVVAAWLWYGLSRDSAIAGSTLFVALGMTLGFVGDLFLARLLPAPNRVLADILAFGIGHVLYIIAIWGYANVSGLHESWGALGLMWLLAIVGWYMLVFRGGQGGALKWAALAYAVLLASTAGLALGLAVQTAVFIPLAVGASLFLLSDLILAGQLFNQLSFSLIDDIIWLTYGPGQMLIVYSIAPVLIASGV